MKLFAVVFALLCAYGYMSGWPGTAGEGGAPQGDWIPWAILWCILVVPMYLMSAFFRRLFRKRVPEPTNLVCERCGAPATGQASFCSRCGGSITVSQSPTG